MFKPQPVEKVRRVVDGEAGLLDNLGSIVGVRSETLAVRGGYIGSRGLYVQGRESTTGLFFGAALHLFQRARISGRTSLLTGTGCPDSTRHKLGSPGKPSATVA